jgi:hypothetical protein
MALITKIDEVRKFLRLNSLNNDRSLPDIEATEQKYIIPVLGNHLYDKLQALYVSNSQDENFMKLILLVRKPLAAYAYLDNIGLLHVSITDAGVRRFETGEMPAVYAWEFRELTKTLSNISMTGMEMLLDYLDENVILWPEWNDSPTKKLRNKLVIKSGKEFSDNYPLFQPLRSYNALRSIIIEVQDNYIVPSIGEDFLNGLLTEIELPHNLEIVRLLKKAVAHYTIKHAVEQLPVNITEQGLTVLTSGNSNDVEYPAKNTPSDSLLEEKRRVADRDGSIYLRKVKAYLNENSNENQFPLYFNSKFYKKPGSGKFDKGNSSRKFYRF